MPNLNNLQELETEQVRQLFAQACSEDDIDTAGFLFSKYLDNRAPMSQFVFEQGVLRAAKSGAPCVTKYLLDKNNFNNEFNLNVMHYSVLIENQDPHSNLNLEVLEALCIFLEDKEELIRIREDGNFQNKEYFDSYLNARLEKENLELSIPQAYGTHKNHKI